MTAENPLATFVSNGKIVWKAYFDSEGLGTPIPAVPRKEGFVGEWEQTVLSDSDVVVQAVYRPVRVKFLQADGTYVVRSNGEPFPEPLEAEDCEGEWEPFRVSDCDITVAARYRGPRHKVRLVVEGKTVGNVVCPAGVLPRFPPVPRKPGFKGRWEPYIPEEGTSIVNAVYEPMEYVFETGIGKTVTVFHGDPFPEPPSRDGQQSRWESRRTASGDCRMTFVYPVSPVLHPFGSGRNVPIVQESGSEVVEPVLVVTEAAPAVEEPVPEPIVQPELPTSRFDRDKVRQAVEDLGFISEHWKTIEEDENPGVPLVNSINLAVDTPEGTEWEKLASLLSPLQKDYLSACVGMRGKPSDVLKRYGSTMLIVETGINALAEDLIGDPLLEEGDVDPDYVNELVEVLKDGNQGRKEVS